MRNPTILLTTLPLLLPLTAHAHTGHHHQPDTAGMIMHFLVQHGWLVAMAAGITLLFPRMGARKGSKTAVSGETGHEERRA